MEKDKIIDFHAHVGITSSGENTNLNDFVSLLKRFDIMKVGICCLSGNDAVAQNNIVYEAVKEYPDFIVGYASINPKDSNAINEVNRALGELKLNGVKFNSWKHGYFGDNCPEITGVLNEIEKYDVHVQVHVGTSPICNPFSWARYAKNHPRIKFVFTHIGCHEFGWSTIESIKDLKNVYVETSCQMEVKTLQHAFKTLGSKRIIFGSDSPYKALNAEIEKLKLLNLTTEELQDVFYKNALILWENN